MKGVGELGVLAGILREGSKPFRLLRGRSGSFWLLPERPEKARGAQRFFPQRHPVLQAAWWAWSRGFPVGGRVLLNADILRELMGEMVPFEAEGLVAYVGTEGAYRKAILGFWSKGGAEAVAKLALTPRADSWVTWEAFVLRKVRPADGAMPRFLRSGRYRERSYLLMTPVDGSLGPVRLSRAHFFCVAQIFRSQSSTYGWGESPLSQEWSLELARDDLVRAYPALQAAFAWLVKRLGQRELTLGWAHRDFAPWNTRRKGGKLWVLDWEMARPSRPPGYDLLHFLSIQAALRGGKPKIPWGMLRAWLETEAPPWAGLERELYAAYLLDQALFYAGARLEAPEEGEDKVLAWLLGELAQVTAR
jgi:hypothetical protein